MKSFSLPEAVIFDMDGLMFDTERLAMEKWFLASEEHGVSSSEESFKRFIGRRNADSLQLLGEIHGADFPAAVFLQRVSDLMKDHVARAGAPRKAGLLELLDWLEEKGIRKAVATSTRMEGAVKSLGDLMPRFEAVVTGDQVVHGKPSPEIFLTAAQRLKVEPSRCVALEDSLLGVQSAAAAGMTVLWVPDLILPTEETRPLAYGIYSSLHEVVEMLKGGGSSVS